jgi:hypothetical protein
LREKAPKARLGQAQRELLPLFFLGRTLGGVSVRSLDKRSAVRGSFQTMRGIVRFKIGGFYARRPGRVNTTVERHAGDVLAAFASTQALSELAQ